jgi:hypothetical protein
MKSVLTSSASPTFTPGAANAGTLNFASAVSSYGFQFGRLLGIINLTQNNIIYTAGVSGYGGTWNSGTSVLTLAQSTIGMNSSDVLEVIWDDPSPEIQIVPPSLTTPSCLSFQLISAAGTNATVVKASPGIINAIYFSGATGGSQFLKFYDTATAPIVGTTTVKLTFAAVTNGANYNGMVSVFVPPHGIKFSNGISIAITGAIANSDTTAITANTCVVNVLYV